MIVWNAWHGCRKFSEGCLNCYMFRRDSLYGKDSTVVEQTGSFNLPIMKNRNKSYKITALDSPVYVCLTSDFFIEEADKWRDAAWEMMHFRKDLDFVIITKRIHRFYECIPKNWFSGYPNVTVICTCENQRTADERLPLFVKLPIARKEITHEPMLERIDVEKYLESGCIERVTCGGESGDNARECDYSWILDTRAQCIKHGVGFYFKQTGAHFRKDGRLYTIERSKQHSQARKACIDFEPPRSPDDNAYDIERQLCRLRNCGAYGGYRLDGMMKLQCRELGDSKLKVMISEALRNDLPPFGRIHGEADMYDPVSIALRATASCCRSCLERQYDIPQDRKLSERELKFISEIVLEWLKREATDEQ